MEDSSSYRFPSIEMLSSKKNYPKWCEEVRDCLNSEGLLCCIEEDSETRRQGFSDGLLIDSTIEDLEKKIDFEALSLIQKHISTDINHRIRHASTAKEAWDMLKSLFQTSVNRNVGSPAENDVKIKVFDENGSYTFYGDKPFFTLFMTKSALKHPFLMNFPSVLHHMLPSIDIEAIVTFKGKDIEISYTGQEKCFMGLGWKHFTEREKLMKGDALVFELFQSEDTGLRFKVQILR